MPSSPVSTPTANSSSPRATHTAPTPANSPTATPPAAEQLGHDQAAVRLAGVYALTRLADDWTEQRQVCIDVLCAYLRMPYEPDPTAPGHKEGEREVRQTIIRVIRGHLQEPDAATAWCRHDFNFTGAVFDGGNFSTSHLRGTTSFFGATFSDGTLTFSRATFSGGAVTFDRATFSRGRVTFERSTLTGGTVTFDDPTFSGTVFEWGPLPVPAGA
ncbi:pentapeptide repeat-containing protein [Streptomyces mirabilis]|uniref:pentapeptide repeat-containing protein n=1 Tax=Streptomyces mirabilis TaxID=68239 RepID=UPI0036CE5B74